MIMFSCVVCVQPWLCHVTTHFNLTGCHANGASKRGHAQLKDGMFALHKQPGEVTVYALNKLLHMPSVMYMFLTYIFLGAAFSLVLNIPLIVFNLFFIKWLTPFKRSCFCIVNNKKRFIWRIKKLFTNLRLHSMQ